MLVLDKSLTEEVLPEPPRHEEFVCYGTKGLISVTRQEVEERLPGARILPSSTEKYLIFSAKIDSLKSLLQLRSANDVHCLLLQKDTDAPITEEDILQAFPIEALSAAESFIRRFRTVDDTFSITLSKHKNENVNLESLRKHLVELVSAHTQRRYTEREHESFDIRLNVEESRVVVSCRIASEALHLRSYKVRGGEGALKPPIAASLILLARPRKGERLVDDFCGTGTILCEGLLQGLDVYGGDIVEERVAGAQANVGNINGPVRSHVKVLDATKSPWPTAHFDLAVSNLPWDKQVEMESVVGTYSGAIREYARILKSDGRLVLLLKKADLAVKHVKLNFPGHRIEQIRIGFLGQTPWVILAYPKDSSAK